MTVKEGDKVKIEYTGTLDDGSVFDSTKHGDHEHPIEFVVGSGQILPGFEKEVIGMKKDEVKEFKLGSKDAYGEKNPEAKKEFPRDILPKDQEPKPGMVLMLSTQTGQQFPAKILEVTDDKLVLDINHPLAGKDLNFKIKIVGIENK